MVQHNGQRVEWDRGGRIKKQPEIWPEPGRSYQWWSEDRLLEVETTKGVKVETTYDVNGNRVKSTETVGGQTDTTGYLVDDSGWLSHVVTEFRAGDPKAVYVRAGDQLLGLSRAGSEDLHYHLDGLGSVRGLTDALGGMVERLDYSAFGRSLGVSSQDYGFTGQPKSAAGLGYHRVRWLDFGAGRFRSVDPWEGERFRPLSFNDYVYSELDPLNRVDPNGAESLVSQAFANAVRGVAAGIQSVAITAYRSTVLTIGRATLLYVNHQARIELAGALSALAFAFVDSGIRAILRNSEAVPAGPNEPGGFLERKFGANATAYRDMDDYRDGTVTSFKTYQANRKSSNLLHQISKVADDLGRHPSFRPKKSHQDLPTIPGSAVKARVLVVAIPENRSGLVSPSFLRTLKQIQQTNNVIIRVLPMKGWKR